MRRDAETAGGSQRYQRLPAGLHGIPPEDVARDQRMRLCAAMAELVAQRGFSGVRISDLTGLAGVSRPTFYELFANKEACLLAAYAEIADDAVSALRGASGNGAGEELRDGLRALVELGAQRPEQMSLLVVGVLGAGPAAGARRQQALRTVMRRLEGMRSGGGRGGARAGRDSPSDRGAQGGRLLMTMLIGGVREVLATRLRRGLSGDSRELSEELASWIECYPQALPKTLLPPSGAAERRSALAAGRLPTFPRTAAPGQRLPSGRHDLSAKFVALNQRERILDAIAAVTARDGYAGLAIPAIAGHAHVSHQTFYEHFASKQESFLAALATSGRNLTRTGGDAFAEAGSWPEGIVAATHTVLRSLAAEPEYARLGVVEALGAGPEALDLRARAVRELAKLVDQGRELALREGRSVPPVAPEAIVGAAWQAIHLEVLAGRTAALPLLAPAVAFLVLTPYLGSKEASRLARRRPR